MIPRERSFWVAQALVLYVCAAHLRSEPGALRAWLGLALGPGMAWIGWRLAAVPPLGADWIDGRARRAAQGVAAAAGLGLAAEFAPSTPGFVAARALALAVAWTCAPLALSRIAALGGAVRQLEHRVDTAWAAGLLWALALGVALLRVASGDGGADALTVDYAVVAASLGSIGIGMVASWRAFVARRFELGVPERAAAALWLNVVCVAVGILAALMEVAAPERVVPLAALAAAGVSSAAAVSQRPALVARALRLAAAVTMLATPLMSVAVVAAYKAPTHAGAIVFVVTGCSVAVGMFAPRIAERMAPSQGRWLRVLKQATVAAKAPDPRQAVTLALSTVRDGLGADEGPATLYRFATSDRWVVDRAGYLHVETGDVPLSLVERVQNEPERVVSTEVLRALEVRAAEVRPWVAWLDSRRAGAAALVLDDEVPVGMFLWPAAGDRVAPLAYDEVRALRALADHLGVAAGAEARLDRSRERELEVTRGMGQVVEESRELRERIARDEGRLRAASTYLADRARTAAYGPASQMALTLAEHLGERGEPLVVVQRPGGDALPWAAVAHLASPRSGSLMLVIDGARREAHILERWTDPARSPLELARGGTLVVLDAQALPRHVQRAIGSSRRADTMVIAVLPDGPSVLAGDRSLDEHFAALFADRVLVPPSLSERAEDLRALALHELVRLGTRLGDRPLGLSVEAQQLLVEHEWPGNEAELTSVLLRAALEGRGDVVGAAAVSSAIGAAPADAASDSRPARRQREAKT